MARRYVSIWFRYLTTDWFTLHQPQLKTFPFVLRTSEHGRMVITAANALAEQQGITRGMVLADARAMIPSLQVSDDKPDLANKLLNRLAEWCIRFTPVVATDPPDGLILDVTGCPHLWGGDIPYLQSILTRLHTRGYHVHAAMADTIGTAWGTARFGNSIVIERSKHIDALMHLPPQALRLEPEVIERLHKLGLHQVRQFIRMPRTSLRRRFGNHFMMRLAQALGQQDEQLHPIEIPEPYHERLPCLEPIATAPGIAIALQQLLEKLCTRLQQEQKGLRKAIFKCYRVDGKTEQVNIGTHLPSYHIEHLFRLFELKLSTIEPALGIELFILEAPVVEDHFPQQEAMWQGVGGLEDVRLAELIDRFANKIGIQAIHRYLPDEHYWPERSFKEATSLQEKPTTVWLDNPRPLQLLRIPERIDVTALIPDYPPMLFRYKGKIVNIVKADGPERIEQEWWLQQGQHRDYYRVEDAAGNRYWIFRLGHYDEKVYQWFIHGFFA
jgi:protein ImuB